MFQPNLLAEGWGAIIPLVVFGVLWLLGQVASVAEKRKKQQQSDQQHPAPDWNTDFGTGPVVVQTPPPAPKPKPKSRQQPKPKNVKPQPPAPVPVEVAYGTTVFTPNVTEPVAKPATSVTVKPTNVATDRIREMLKPAGVRDAFILNEILNKPVSMRD
jgi:hypothetical protein